MALKPRPDQTKDWVGPQRCSLLFQNAFLNGNYQIELVLLHFIALKLVYERKAVIGVETGHMIFKLCFIKSLRCPWPVLSFSF